MNCGWRSRLTDRCGAAEPPQLANAAAVDAAMERLKESLLAIGFLPEENPDHLMFTLRGIFSRSGLAPRELEIINGIAKHTKWAAEGGHETLAAKRAAGQKVALTGPFSLRFEGGYFGTTKPYCCMMEIVSGILRKAMKFFASSFFFEDFSTTTACSMAG